MALSKLKFQAKSFVKVIDPAMPAMSEESTPGTPIMLLFVVRRAVQTTSVDTGRFQLRTKVH